MLMSTKLGLSSISLVNANVMFNVKGLVFVFLHVGSVNVNGNVNKS